MGGLCGESAGPVQVVARIEELRELPLLGLGRNHGVLHRNSECLVLHPLHRTGMHPIGQLSPPARGERTALLGTPRFKGTQA